MTIVKCKVEGCQSSFTTNEVVAPNASYICKLHAPAEQDAFFQEHQFDRDLKLAHKPQGTHHIPNQGSEVMTSEEIEYLYSWERGRE